MHTIPLRLVDKPGASPQLLLGGVDITPYVARDGLRIEYVDPAERQLGDVPRAVPEVTIRFALGKLELDFDIELLGRLLDDARSKAGGE